MIRVEVRDDDGPNVRRGDPETRELRARRLVVRVAYTRARNSRVSGSPRRTFGPSSATIVGVTKR
jgi:hypothetical protein